MVQMTLVRALRSEFIKFRRSPLVPLHLILAIVLGGCAGAYFSYAAWDSMLGTDAFFQLLGSGIPLLVGISCGLAIDAEQEAGGCLNLLGVPSRRIALVAKVVVLLVFLLVASCVAAIIFFGILMCAGKSIPPCSAFMAASLGIVIGSIALYVFFLFVALRFGRNVSIGVGAFGFMVAMASMGGLANGLVTGTFSGATGAGIAPFIPFTWPSRFASLSIELAIAQMLPEGFQTVTLLTSILGQISLACVLSTFILAVLTLARADHFENKRYDP